MVCGAGVGASVGEDVKPASPSPAGDVVDDHAAPTGLQDLQMFQAGAHNLSQEIDHLDVVQGEFTVRDVDEKKIA